MLEFKYTIKDEIGLHARPAGLLVKEAKKFASDITVVSESGKIADAKKLFSLMSLAITKNDSIKIIIDGPDEEDAGKTIMNFLRSAL